MTAQAWPEADRVFRDAHPWIGGDGGYSVQVAPGRHAWLFADSWLAYQPTRNRWESFFVNACTGWQEGTDPTTARLEVHFDLDDQRVPTSVFPSPFTGQHIWPAEAAMVGDRLLVFFTVIEDVPRPPEDVPNLEQFRLVGWHAKLVTNPTDHPRDWEQVDLEVPDLPGIHVLGASGLVVHDGHLYAHAWPHGERGKEPSYVARFRLDDAARGDLGRGTWWCGPRRGWLPYGEATGHLADTGLEPLPEYTIHRDAATGRFLSVQMLGREDASIGVRWADAPQGPWSRRREVYRAPEARDGTAMAYGAKAHPGLLRDGAVLVTYNTNTIEIDAVMDRDDLFVPHCVALRVHPRRSLRDLVRRRRDPGRTPGHDLS